MIDSTFHLIDTMPRPRVSIRPEINGLKIALAGGGGFLGSAIAREIDHDGTLAPLIIGRPAEFKDIAIYQKKHCDITESLLTELFEKNDVSALVNLSDGTRVRSPWDKSELTEELRIQNTDHIRGICNACAAHAIPLIHISSAGALYRHGDSDESAIDENSPVDPKSVYGILKLDQEKIIRQFSKTRNLSGRIFRVSNPYGPGQNPFKNQGVIANWVKCFETEKDIELRGSLLSTRDYLYIEDFSKAILLTLKAPIERMSTYNLCSSESHSLQDILEALRILYPSSRVGRVQTNTPQDVTKQTISNDAFHRDFNWSPAVRLEDGIARYIKWFRSIFNES